MAPNAHPHFHSNLTGNALHVYARGYGILTISRITIFSTFHKYEMNICPTQSPIVIILTDMTIPVCYDHLVRQFEVEPLTMSDIIQASIPWLTDTTTVSWAYLICTLASSRITLIQWSRWEVWKHWWWLLHALSMIVMPSIHTVFFQVSTFAPKARYCGIIIFHNSRTTLLIGELWG